MASLCKEYGEEMEEYQIQNWEYQQTKMNKSLNELIQNLNYGKSPSSKDNSGNGPKDLELTNLENDTDPKSSSKNSSAAEFKRYLEDLKRSYLEKLAFSCPPKITKKLSNLQANSNSNPQTENNNKLKSLENLSNLLNKKYDSMESSSSARRTLFNDNAKTNQETIDKNAVSVEEKSAEQPELSNTQILSRLVQIRDYLKQAYSMLTTLQTSNNPINYSAQMSKLHCLIDHLKDQERGYMDLLSSLSKFQEMNDNLFCEQIKQENENKNSNSFNNDSEAGSICGSFISDTLTLNCGNGINEIMEKYRKAMNNAPDNLVVVGKSVNKSMENEEDERTENDQDCLEFEDDYVSSLIKNSNKANAEQKEETMKQMNVDLDTLEQLREQKQLLKSIRLRKEELKALEGRRKALEALKKIATDGEEQVNDAFKILPITDQSHEDNFINPSSICINRGVQTETLTTPRKPMIRKTVKSKDLSRSQENIDCSQIEPSSQIEKSKITAKHYEDLIRKILTEKYTDNLLRTVSNSDMATLEQGEHCQKSLEQDCTEAETQEELKLRLKDLSDHEKKLDELYKMQSKLANLKTFMNEFEEMKNSQVICDMENVDQENQEDEEDEKDEDEDELRKENVAKKQLIEIHKQKLINAKEKLKELQNLISRLQIISDEAGIEANSNGSAAIDDKIEQETFSYLKKAEIKHKEEKLDELNRNKQKLLELLKKKEQEAAGEEVNNNFGEKNSNSTNEIAYLNEIESKFKAAEYGFDMLSVENLPAETETCQSPSDLLWSKMKKQLAMRENLRSQKSELEECIRDEYSKPESGKSLNSDGKNDDGNEILSAYRGFLMRGADIDKQAQSDTEQEAESHRSERKSESESSESEWIADDEQQAETYQPKQSADNLERLSDKFENILLNQQKMNEKMFNKFNELIEKKSLDQSSQNSNQFQTQLHIQQLMFNLNTAYHEISTQRSEISRLNEQMLSVNKQLAEIGRPKNVSSTIGINTEDLEQRNEPSRASMVAALPSYFYNRKKHSHNMEINDYTDDFEELDEEEEEEKKNKIRTESSLSSTSNARSSISSSTLSLRKSLMKHRSGQHSALYKSLTFDKMREQIYSEVAALISQNESRPFYLLNLFKELQFIKDKNARDQTLKSIFNISNRQSNIKLNCMKKSYSNMEEQRGYVSKKYESDRQNEADEESTPFESDSLSNTVIFVKNSPKSNQVDRQTSNNNSSGSSIMGVEEENIDKENIGAEVKQLISKIILNVKNSENFDSEDESEKSPECEKKLFNWDYLNEIVEKVHQVLTESPKHCDYLNYYSAQLTCYLKEALVKYENKYLTECMEDVLIEISDILYNELTFYSTLKTNRSKQLSNSSSSMASSGVEFSDQIEQTENNFRKCKYQSVELLKRLSSILNNKFGDLKTIKDQLMDDRLTVEKNKLENLKFDLKREFDNFVVDSDSLKAKYGASAIKYLNGSSEPDSSVCGEDNNFHGFDTESDKDQLPYKVVDADEYKENEITIDDIPIGNQQNLAQAQTTDLDKIIMESICDQLVGNADEMIKIEATGEREEKKQNEENGSLKSDSSNSDHFVIIDDSKKENKEKLGENCSDLDKTEQNCEQGSMDEKNTQ